MFIEAKLRNTTVCHQNLNLVLLFLYLFCYLSLPSQSTNNLPTSTVISSLKILSICKDGHGKRILWQAIISDAYSSVQCPTTGTTVSASMMISNTPSHSVSYITLDMFNSVHRSFQIGDPMLFPTLRIVVILCTISTQPDVPPAIHCWRCAQHQ